MGTANPHVPVGFWTSGDLGKFVRTDCRGLSVGPGHVHADDGTMPPLPNPTAADLLERQFLDMRHKLLILAADFDRIQRAHGGDELLQTDPRVQSLRDAAALLIADAPERAKTLQLNFSDKSPVENGVPA